MGYKYFTVSDGCRGNIFKYRDAGYKYFTVFDGFAKAGSATMQCGRGYVPLIHVPCARAFLHLERLRKAEVDVILREFVERVWADALADDKCWRI